MRVVVMVCFAVSLASGPAHAAWQAFTASSGLGSNSASSLFEDRRAGTATVSIYNRAGRLIRTVADGSPFVAGANLVRWDGRDRDGEIVESGLYLVAVEALDQHRTEAIAVVR